MSVKDAAEPTFGGKAGSLAWTQPGAQDPVTHASRNSPRVYTSPGLASHLPDPTTQPDGACRQAAPHGGRWGVLSTVLADKIASSRLVLPAPHRRSPRCSFSPLPRGPRALGPDRRTHRPGLGLHRPLCFSSQGERQRNLQFESTFAPRKQHRASRRRLSPPGGDGGGGSCKGADSNPGPQPATRGDREAQTT